MNAPVLLAQLAGSSPQTNSSAKNIKLEKPQNGAAVTVHLDGHTQLDFSDIATEKLTFVRIGDKLIVLFDNQSTVTVDPVFSPDGHPLADITFEMAPDRTLTGDEFASLFPITTDQSILPAAGNGSSGPTAGANFSAAHVDGLGASGTPLGLLGEDNGALAPTPSQQQQGGNPTPIPGAIDVVTVNEDGLARGNPGGLGDVGTLATTVTGSLNVNFGSDTSGRSFSFAADQAGLTGLTSDAQTVHLFVTTVGGLPTLIGFVGSDPSIVANQVFTVSLDANATVEGTFTFTLLRPLDHPIVGIEDTLNLTVNVIATDGSGDTAPTVIRVDVNDDSPIIVAANETHSTLVDPVSGTVATQTGSLGISWGADRFNDHVDGGVSAATGHTGDRAVVFSDAIVSATGDAAGVSTPISVLTSHGQTVQYALLDNGTVLVAYTGATIPTVVPADAKAAAGVHVVFVASLSDASDTGSYVISQYQSLDHNSGGVTFDAIDLGFHFTATDSDGDPVSGTLTATITDTVPVVAAAIGLQTVTESTSSTSTGAVSLNIDWKSDDNNPTPGAGPHDRSVAFTADTLTTLAALHLTSNGVAITYSLSADGQTLTAQAAATTVFTVQLSDAANGSYTFTLSSNLDNGPSSGPNNPLPFSFTATDSDGDTTAPASFSVHVTDSVPVTPASATLAVDEHGLVAAADVVVSSTNAALAPGADGFSGGSLATAIHFTTLPTGLTTSDGTAIDISQSGNVVTGVRHDTNATVFTLTVAADGTYTFDQSAALHHPGAGTDTDSLGFGFTITDGDGDVSSAASITVNVKDDVPVTPASATLAVDEHGLVAAADVVVSSTNAALAPGADGFSGGALASAIHFTTLPTGLTTSDGTAIDISQSGNVVTGVRHDTNATVFTLTVAADGTYTFDQSAALHHPGAGTDTDSLGFGFTITDGDGDVSSAASITVNVKDDVPVTPASATLAVDEHGLVAAADVVVSSTNAALAPGADGFSGGSLATAIHFTTLPTGLTTSDGTAIDISQSGNVVTGVRHDTNATVFTLTVAADGTYTFDQSAALHHPGAGTDTDSLGFGFTITDGDGDVSSAASITVNVKDDVPVTPASATLAVDEHGLVAAADVVVSSTNAALAPGADGFSGGALASAIHFTTLPTGLTTSDGTAIDISQSGNVVTGVRHDTNATVFTLTVGADGTYTFDQSAALHHPGAGTDTDSLGFGFTITDGDGDVSSAASITVNVKDDVPTAANVSSATDENTPITIDLTGRYAFGADGAGTPAITLGTATVDGPAGVTLGLPTVVLNPDGHTVTVTPGTAFDPLAAGQQATLHIPFTVTDGDGDTVTKEIAIIILGTNDAAVIGGTDTQHLTETNAVLTTSGALTISDVDSPATFVAQTNAAGSNGYGKFSIDASGNWTYTTNTAHDEFVGGQTYTDTLTVASADGTTHVLTVTILGTNDAAVIGGTDTQHLTETNAVLTTSGALTISDVDSPATFVAQTNAAGSNGYGKFSIDASGNWTYTTNTAHDEFVGGQTYTDTLTVASADGTTHLLTITILGTNDAAVIGGTDTQHLTETNAVLTTSGALTISDVDSPATFVAQTNAAGSNGYGKFSIDASGNWTYTTNTAHDEFVGGQTYTDTLTVASADGTTHVLTVTILGTNDAAVIGGTDTQHLTETNAVLTTSGALTISDVDSPATFVAQTNAAGSNGYGKFSIDASGNWTYTTNTAHDEFVGGQTYTDTLTVASADGTTHVLTVTILGTNDAAVIGGTDTQHLTETNAVLTTSGALTISDVDSPATFVAQTNAAGSNGYGKFSIDASGNWTYTTNTAHDEFVGGQTYTDTLTVASADGTTHVLTVTILGTNDAAVIGGTDTQHLTETNAVLTTSGALTISDVDSPATFVAQTNAAGSNGYGKFSIDASGNWTYTTNTAHDEFVGGQTYTDTLTVASADGTTHVLTVTILGTNDAAVIGGTDTQHLTETNAVLTTSGALTISDVDSPATFVAQTNAAGSNGYGKFSIDASGNWTYTTNTAHDEFVGGQTYTDTLTVASADGTTHVLTVTVLGTNDAAVIGGTDTQHLTETNAVLMTSGALTISDVDSPATFVAQTNAAGSNGYGKFSIDASGNWTYTTNTAHDEFVGGQTYTDTLTVASADGTTHVLTVTILGTNDAATFSGADTGTVVEAGGTANTMPGTPTTGGTLTVTDVDSSNAVVAQNNVVTTYGHFTIDALGVWSYALDNTNSTVQALNTGSTALHDLITVTTADRTTHQINVTINGSNDAPVAVADSYTAVEDTLLQVTATTGVLHNDSDVDSAALTASLVAGPTHFASFTLNADGSFSYQAAANYAGTDSFSYKANDGSLDSNIVTVNLTITPVNDGPATLTISDTTQTATAPKVGDVLQANLGADPDGAESNILYHWLNDGSTISGATSSTYTIATGDLGHKLSVNTTYTDGQNFNENVTSLQTAAVISGNHAPVARDDVYAGSAPPAPSDLNTWSYDSANGHYYKVVLSGIGWADAKAAAAAAGGYLATVTDSQENSFIDSLAQATFISAPFQYAEGVWLGGSDAAVEGTWRWVTGPEAGQLITYTNWNTGEPNNTGGNENDLMMWTYSPAGTWNDANSPSNSAANFGYVIEYGGIVTGAPTEDTPVVIAASSLLANDSDQDAGDTFSITSVQSPTHGTVVLSADHQTVTFTPNANYNGAASFTYTIADSHGASSTATVSFNLAAVNHPPVAVADTINVNEDATASAGSRATGVLANDTDPDTGDAATLVVSAVLAGTTGTASAVSGTGATVVSGIYGNLSIHTDGTYSYTPNNASAEALAQGVTANDVFTYTAQDTSGATSTTTLTFHITGQDDAPVNTVPSAQNTTGNLVFSSALGDAISVSDVDTPNLTETLAVSHGTLTLSGVSGLTSNSGNGTANVTFSGSQSAIDSALNGLIYSPTTGYSGADSLQIGSNDGTLTTNSTVAISVVGNHAPVLGTTGLTGSVTEDATVGAQLVNGGFDASPLGTGWTQTLTSGIASIDSFFVDNNTPHSYDVGSYFGWSQPTDSTIGQSINTSIGAQYTLHFALAGYNGSASDHFNVLWNGQVVEAFTGGQVVSNYYQYFTATVTGTGGSDQLQFVAADTTKNAWWDLDSVSLIPTTPSIAVEKTSGTITFTDQDTADTHTVTQAAPTFSLSGGGTLPGDLTALISGSSLTLTETDGPSGSVAWSYQIADSAIQSFLGAGQTLTESYAVTVRDNHNASATQDVVITIHGTTPTVVSEAITSATGVQNNLLNAGDVVSVTVTMNEAVTVTGTPQLALLVGTSTVQAQYVSGSGSSALVFNYIIQPGQTDTDGISIPLNALNLSNGGTITDIDGKTAVLSAGGVTDNAIYMVDTTAPTVAVSEMNNGGSGVVTFDFSEAVLGFTNASISKTKVTLVGGLVHDGIVNGLDQYHENFTYSSGSGRKISVTTGSYTDLAGNSGSAGNTGTFPAGVSGEPIHLALSDFSTDHAGAISLTIAGLATGWALSEGTHNADGSWTVQTNDIASLSVTSPDGYTGALVANVSESWTNADGTVGHATVIDNVEAYAKGSPIFVWSGDDTLTASIGSDTLVFANQIGKDVVHNFDTAHDKIDLIGFTGFTGFADVQAHLGHDASGNAVLTLADGETITLNGVNAAALNAGDFEFNQVAVTYNTGDMVIGDGALLPLSGVVDNAGSIHLGAIGSETDLEIVQHGVTLQGGGTLVMSDNGANVIFGSDPSVTLTNVDNIISGAGQLGDGQMTLVNEGSIIATGSNALVIDTGANTVINSGTLESTGAGGLVVHSDLANDGRLWANGGNIQLDGNVSGAGSALISGNATLELGGSFNERITFDANASGTLKLDHSVDFKSILAGFGDHDAIDLGDILAATAAISYAANAAGTGGTLTVNDGAHTANIAVTGQYAASDFHIASDSTNHALVQIEHQAHQMAAAA